MNQEYHVSIHGDDKNCGTAEFPFRSISKAAKTALYGDTITVHEGVYREWVKPARSGQGNTGRITYQAAAGEQVVIKGSEVITDWKEYGGSVWLAEIDNEIFGDYNPYAETIDGDWLLRPREPFLHTGEVYLEGSALQEVFKITETAEKVLTWFAEVREDVTIIYANFGESNPNENIVEINVRKSCFSPEKNGVDYITVRGFEMAHAATTWAPPVAEQTGMLAAHWSKGWIIEDNTLHDAKCSGISLGLGAVGQGYPVLTVEKSGYHRQIETVFKAKQSGWAKEFIGSHIVRNNTIYDCGQTGIVGHMGSAFSRVYGNHIYNIGKKCGFYGFEMAGIKFHAAIDTQIYENYIHDCGGFGGIWMDWQAQGVRVSRNLFLRNAIDIFFEVNHGPYLVDNNIFASEHNLRNISQGGAYVHNLFCGTSFSDPDLGRTTPYHFPHTTDIAGFAQIYGGDDRFYQNIFAGTVEEEGIWKKGTNMYQGCPDSYETFIRQITELGHDAAQGKDPDVKQPAYIESNCYFCNAPSYEGERNKVTDSADIQPVIKEEKGKVYLEMDVPVGITKPATVIITTGKLGMPRYAHYPYENPDGTELSIDTDYNGCKRTENPAPGPFENPGSGHIKLLVWRNRNDNEK